MEKVRHWAFLPGLFALVLALFLTIPRRPDVEPRSPILGVPPADPAAVATLREVSLRNLASEERDKGKELRRRACEIGEPASRALVEILAGRFAETNFDWWSSADLDEWHELEGVLIGELATEATARSLLRSVEDDDLKWGLRRAFVVALCRARFPFAAGPLAELACDRRVEPDLREAILYRFHRFGCPPPACLHDLLYQPYQGLDVVAAATLALCGDPEAPSLILEGLSPPRAAHDESTLTHCAEAAWRITGKPLEFSHSYVVSRRATPGGSATEMTKSVSGGDGTERVASHVRALQEWMATHEPSAFERERREYLASDRRARELTLRSVDDVLAAGDDFDLAAASLWLTGTPEEEGGRSLERLNRLSVLCGRRLTGVEDPEERIRILNDLLAKVAPVETDPEFNSHLPAVLGGDYGNCLARTTLYMAIADRLSLPIRPYDLPHHVYVAWVEEGVRRNIETTEGGADRPGEGAPASRRRILGYHLSNRATALVDREDFPAALRCAESALKLDRENPQAYFVRAVATWHTDLSADPRPDLDRAVEFGPEQDSVWITSAQMSLELGFAEDALRRAQHASRLVPSADATTTAARAHLALRHAARARELAEEAAERWPREACLRHLLFELDVDRRDSEALKRNDISPLWKARALIDRASPECALEELEGGREEVLKDVEQGFPGGAWDRIVVRAAARARREYHLLRARALVGLERVDEAREALRAAEEAAPPIRETLEVRRLLEHAK